MRGSQAVILLWVRAVLPWCQRTFAPSRALLGVLVDKVDHASQNARLSYAFLANQQASYSEPQESTTYDPSRTSSQMHFGAKKVNFDIDHSVHSHEGIALMCGVHNSNAPSLDLISFDLPIGKHTDHNHSRQP